jgi:Fe-S-cluster-containing hydrogenase component 2
MLRKIVEIDEEKCDGCGLCVQACVESAIRIIDGKARLISETYCDGLGACIGECPNDAITITEREAEEFDEEVVRRHLADEEPGGKVPERGPIHACPGSRMLDLAGEAEAAGGKEIISTTSRLRNWPVQLRLAPIEAPYYRGADLLLAADCVPFALADFHGRMLEGKILLIGCPKLDDAALYSEKLLAILKQNDIRSLSVAHMEVPCCRGLLELARRAIEESGKPIPLEKVEVGIRGQVLAEVQ